MVLDVADEDRLSALLTLTSGDPGWIRRRFRRKRMMTSAIVKGPDGVSRATILDMSPGGMFIKTDLDGEVGDAVLVKIGVPGTTQHSFPCEVVRVEDGHLAVMLTGIPLEVRYGSYEPRKERGRVERPRHPFRIRSSA
jgi:Tfp pilus assembly protein PilZ